MFDKTNVRAAAFANCGKVLSGMATAGLDRAPAKATVATLLGSMLAAMRDNLDVRELLSSLTHGSSN